jgi:hypothetical protein
LPTGVHKKLTITVDEQDYEGLHRVIGRQKISHFIETRIEQAIKVQLALGS